MDGRDDYIHVGFALYALRHGTHMLICQSAYVFIGEVLSQIIHQMQKKSRVRAVLFVRRRALFAFAGVVSVIDGKVPINGFRVSRHIFGKLVFDDVVGGLFLSVYGHESGKAQLRLHIVVNFASAFSAKHGEIFGVLFKVYVGIHKTERRVAPRAPIAVGVVAHLVVSHARAVALYPARPVVLVHFVLIYPAPDKVGIGNYIQVVQPYGGAFGDVRIVVAHEHTAQHVFQKRINAVCGAVVGDVCIKRVVARNIYVSAAAYYRVAVVLYGRSIYG